MNRLIFIFEWNHRVKNRPIIFKSKPKEIKYKPSKIERDAIATERK